MTYKRVSFFMAIIFTGLSLWVNAAEEPAADTENSVGANAGGQEELVLNQADGNNENDSEPEQSEGDDDFIPSAQISEDLSVSFPVDI
jgi:hypothetical protein